MATARTLFMLVILVSLTLTQSYNQARDTSGSFFVENVDDLRVQECVRNKHSSCVAEAGSSSYCTCQMDLSRSHHCNSSSQSLQVSFVSDSHSSQSSEDRRLIPYKVKNPTEIELFIQEENPGIYYVACSSAEDEWNDIPILEVHVGYGALDVENFTCTSYNLEELVCWWDLPHNPASGGEKYRSYLEPDFECRWEGRCSFNRKSRRQCCSWNQRTGYSPGKNGIHMFFDVRDVFTGEDDHFNHFVGSKMLPDQPRNFTAQALDDETTFSVEWSTPPALIGFREGLLYQIDSRIISPGCSDDFYCNWMLTDNGTCSNRSCTARPKVPFPGLEYEVRLKLRSGDGDSTLQEDGLWSMASSTTITISPQAPSVSPDITPGMFQSLEDLYDVESRDVTVTWQPIHFTRHNGPDFRYVLQVTSDQIPNDTRFVRTTETHVTLANLSRNLNYRWQGGQTSKFTVYLCLDSVTSPSLCQGDMYWKKFEGVASVNVTLADFNMGAPTTKTRIPRFAISTETDDGVSSGINWACCGRPRSFKDSPPRQPEIKEATEINTTSVLMKWTLPCEDSGVVLKGVVIDYCPGVHQFVTNCTVNSVEGSFSTSASDCLNQFLLTGLIPNMKYSAWVTVRSRAGLSPRSNAKIIIISEFPKESHYEVWKIALLSFGCLVAVAITVVAVRLSVRRVLFIKKQFDRRPELPPGISYNVGRFTRESSGQTNVLHQIPQIIDVDHRQKQIAILESMKGLVPVSSSPKDLQNTEDTYCCRSTEKQRPEEQVLLTPVPGSEIVCKTSLLKDNLKSVESRKAEPCPPSRVLDHSPDDPPGSTSNAPCGGIQKKLESDGVGCYIPYPMNDFHPPNSYSQIDKLVNPPSVEGTPNRAYVTLDILNKNIVPCNAMPHPGIICHDSGYVKLSEINVYGSPSKLPTNNDVTPETECLIYKDERPISSNTNTHYSHCETPKQLTTSPKLAGIGYVSLNTFTDILSDPILTKVASAEIEDRTSANRDQMI